MSAPVCGAARGAAAPARSRLVDLGGPFRLESGAELDGVTVAYETWGRLAPARDNAVLICHALSGDAHAAGHHGEPGDEGPGWWDFFIGPGRPLDTDRCFVVCSNFLGGCCGTTGPTSVDPATGRPYGPDFPAVTIGDMVEAQRLLVDHLGIDRLLAVIGGSMGGMQVLEWARRYPARVAGAVPVATSHRLSAQAIAFNETGRLAITGDPRWRGGRYSPGEGPAAGLALARMIGHITYLSGESMGRKFGSGGAAGARVERYLRRQGERFVGRFDANTYVGLTRAMDRFDLQGGHASLAAACAPCRSRFLVISFTSDWLFPPPQSREIVKALVGAGADVAYCNLASGQGHDAFLLPGNGLGDVVSGFLGRLAAEAGP